MQSTNGARNGVPQETHRRRESRPSPESPKGPAGAPIRGTPRTPDLFERAAAWTVRATGGRWGFLGALLVVLTWALTGPIFHYSALWQLVINTGTSVATFLMVFLIQNAQNRESKAVHLKL